MMTSVCAVPRIARSRPFRDMDRPEHGDDLPRRQDGDDDPADHNEHEQQPEGAPYPRQVDAPRDRGACQQEQQYGVALRMPRDEHPRDDDRHGQELASRVEPMQR